MSVISGIKEALVKWLGIYPAQQSWSVNIRENLTRELTVLQHSLWYRGDPVEIEQFYKQTAGNAVENSTVLSSRFWAASTTNSHLIRKFHGGIPRMIVDKLAAIVADDMNAPDGENASAWKAFAEEVDFDDIIKDAVVRTLTEGDGAFKVCVDPEVSDKPLLEFYSGNNVEFKYKRGKLVEIHFLSDYFDSLNKHYKLVEVYGKGKVDYMLYDDAGNNCELDTLEDTADLAPVTFDGDYIMGVPLRFFKSAKWKDHGDSIFEGKVDIFDALDECLSTWLDAMRAGRVKQYIPESLIPRNTATGGLITPDVFNSYIAIGAPMQEGAVEEIVVKQGDINYEGLLATYMTMLDCALQGIISPSTLGIDVKKLDNAESQREKEKTTMYTRDVLIGVLSKTLPKLANVVLKTQDNINKKTPEEYKVEFEWGQYANPSFEAMVETIGKAKTQGIMSIEQCVEELYGDTMSEEDKAEEVARLKAEQAAAAPPVDEPAVNDEVEV